MGDYGLYLRVVTSGFRLFAQGGCWSLQVWFAETE